MIPYRIVARTWCRHNQLRTELGVRRGGCTTKKVFGILFDGSPCTSSPTGGILQHFPKTARKSSHPGDMIHTLAT